MSIGKNQVEIINYSKKFINKIDETRIKSYLSGVCYPALWGQNLGYAKIKFHLNGWRYSLKYIYLLLKNILSISVNAEYEVIRNSSKVKDNKILILTWGFKNNFNQDGTLFDRYFKESSNEIPNSHWILLSMDGYVPNNLSDNITVVRIKKGFFKYLFFYFIKVVIKKIFECQFSLKKIFHYLNFYSHLADFVSKIVKEELVGKNYKILLLPYEGQPFQLTSIIEAKKIDQKIKTLGYIHTVLTPNPCEYIYRKGSPDYILIHGRANSEILEKTLYWPKNKIIFTESLRFREDQDRKLSNIIFTPTTIDDHKKYLNEFEKFVKSSPDGYFPILRIRSHPAGGASSQQIKHDNFKNKLESIMKLYHDRFSKTPKRQNIGIFFGVTASIFEALESGVEDIIHICGDPIFESHSQEIWPNLTVEQKSENLFSYKLKNKGKYIAFGSKKNILNELLKKF